MKWETGWRRERREHNARVKMVSLSEQYTNLTTKDDGMVIRIESCRGFPSMCVICILMDVAMITKQISDLYGRSFIATSNIFSEKVAKLA